MYMAQQAKVAWFELPADDTKRASSFYSKVFGWDTPEMGGGAFFALTTPSDKLANPAQPGAINGDISPRSEGLDRPLIMILVEDLDAQLKNIEEAGGTIRTPRQNVAEMGLAWAVFIDTEGNHVGVYEFTPQQ